MTESIIIAIIGSGALSTIISLIATALSNRKNKLNDIESKLTVIEANQRIAEKDSLRTQLLLMIADYPTEKTEILKLAQHYFKDLRGNWTATAIFNTWLGQYCEGVKPEWFRGEEQ